MSPPLFAKRISLSSSTGVSRGKNAFFLKTSLILSIISSKIICLCGGNSINPDSFRGIIIFDCVISSLQFFINYFCIEAGGVCKNNFLYDYLLFLSKSQTKYTFLNEKSLSCPQRSYPQFHN